MQLTNKKKDPPNWFVESDRQSSETQWAMGNVESVSKKLKNFGYFFDENCPEKKFETNPHKTPLS